MRIYKRYRRNRRALESQYGKTQAAEPLSPRRQTLLCLGAAGCALSAGSALAEDAKKMVVHKSPTCGCCGGWAKHMRAAGFIVEEINEPDMKAIKAKFGVPEKMASRHTAEVDGYIIEGHAPAQAVAQLLKERPKAVGLAARHADGLARDGDGRAGGLHAVFVRRLGRARIRQMAGRQAA